MKPRSHAWAVLLYNAHQLPRGLWMLLGILCLNISIPAILAIALQSKAGAMQASGFVTSFTFIPIMFCGILALQFFIAGTGWSGTASAWLMPGGEFLLARPVLRRTVYRSRILLYFVVLLLPMLPYVGLTMAVPDLKLSLYESGNPVSGRIDRASLYQEQFPDSTLIHARKGSFATLIVPNGALLVAFWQFWLTILLALALQATSLLELPSKMLIGLLVAICVVPTFMVAFHLLGNPTPILEYTLFIFAHHWITIALGTLGVFVFIQRKALTRIENLEII
jgi:hypothetical protein